MYCGSGADSATQERVAAKEKTNGRLPESFMVERGTVRKLNLEYVLLGR